MARTRRLHHGDTRLIFSSTFQAVSLSTCWAILETVALRPAHFDEAAILQLLRPVDIDIRAAAYRRNCTRANAVREETETFTRGQTKEEECADVEDFAVRADKVLRGEHDGRR